MKITLPPLPEGAERWHVYAVQPALEIPKDTRTLYQKTAYNLLMFLHGQSENLWHWCYKRSLSYAPPRVRQAGETYQPLMQQKVD